MPPNISTEGGWLERGHPAVHGQAGTSHVRRRIAQQVDQCRIEFGLLPEASHHAIGLQVGADRVLDPFGQFGDEVAGAERIYADSLALSVLVQGEVDERGAVIGIASPELAPVTMTTRSSRRNVRRRSMSCSRLWLTDMRRCVPSYGASSLLTSAPQQNHYCA